jgi:hypothetical protein
MGDYIHSEYFMLLWSHAKIVHLGSVALRLSVQRLAAKKSMVYELTYLGGSDNDVEPGLIPKT